MRLQDIQEKTLLGHLIHSHPYYDLSLYPFSVLESSIGDGKLLHINITSFSNIEFKLMIS